MLSNIRSSYKNIKNFSYIVEIMIFLNNPNKIVEFGILDGYSLNIMANNISKSCTIDAYDLFDDFNGNHSNYEYI